MPALRQNCDAEEMEMNLKMKNIIAASTGTRAEDDVLMVPIPHQPGPAQTTICSGKGPKFCPPSPLLWTPIGYVKRIGAVENSDHNTITIPEPQICRICDFGEEEHDDDVLVELGCSCKGQMSRMHRKCILKWYGVRILLEKLYKCELCNTVLHPKTQLIVARGVADHENGGRAILMNALKSSLASYAPQIEVERAATYKELVQLLLDERAEWYRHRRQIVVNIEALPANSQEGRQGEPFPPRCSRGALALVMGATSLGVGLYIYLIHHFYGNAAFH